MSDNPPSPQTRRRDTDAGSTTASITVSDEQRRSDLASPVDAARWTALAAAVLDAELHGAPVEVSIVFVDEERMAELRHAHMGVEGSTDVLAFPIDDEPDPAAPAGLPRLLGDVVICPVVAARNAPDHAGTLDDEIALLLVHGLLHLLGMDHADEPDRRRMQARERALLLEHHGAPARDPWS